MIRTTGAPRRFQRELLPHPLAYYTGAGLRLIGRGPWRSAICPFHDDHAPSLRVKVENGAYRCMACGAKGSGVLAFHCARYGLSFAEAARDLLAWRD